MRAGREEGPVNVLLLVCDALRADHLGCCGYGRETSPFMDRLAREGVLFRNTVANCNHTLPGLLTAFTGLDQAGHGIVDPASFGRWARSWQDRKTPFSTLRENGWTVAGQDIAIYRPLDFDLEIRDPLQALGELAGKRFFLWYRPETTHLPYDPPAPYDTLFLPPGYEPPPGAGEKLGLVRSRLIVHRPGLVSRLESGEEDPINKEGYERTFGVATFREDEIPAVTALYDGEVRHLDDEIRAYVGRLEELGILDETLVVITSDHGEQLLERGALGHSSCSLEGNLHDENIMIPLIMRCPRLLPRGVTVTRQVSQADIMPTVFDLLGLSLPGRVDGSSLLPLVGNENAVFPEEAWAMTQPCGWQVMKGDRRMIYCLRTPGWKLVLDRDPDRPEPDGYRLFDLRRDPGETRDVISRHPGIAASMREKLLRRIAPLEKNGP